MDGYERLKNLYRSRQEKNTDKGLIKIIKHLLNQEGMSECYLKGEKNFEQMDKFLHEKAREYAVNNIACVPDEIVYQWASEYFSKSDEELGINKPKPVAPIKTVKKEEKNDNNQIQMALELA